MDTPNKEASRFNWLESSFLVAIISTILAALFVYINELHLNNLRYQQDLLRNYFDVVEKLLVDQIYEIGIEDVYPDRSPKPIKLFITSKGSTPTKVALLVQSKTGTTLQGITDETMRDTLLKFLRRANIGFLPRSGDLTQVDVLEGISKTQSLQYSDLLRGIDLSYVQLSNSDLALAVLQDADLTGASLIKSKLPEANLRKSRLVKTILRGANLTGSDLREADLREADLRSTTQITGSWNPIEFFKKLIRKQPTKLYKANLRGADLQKAKLQGDNFQGANLVYAKLIDRDGAEENEAQINHETSFTYALYVPENGTKFPKKFYPDDQCMIAIKPKLNLPDFLKKCSYQDKLLRKTTFAKENFSGKETAFDRVNPLRKTDLSRTNMQGANLTPNVDFFQTNLAKANLAEANLAKANLAEANLKKANLKKANLKKANLKKANLAETINLTPSQIKSACNWQQATYRAEYSNEKETWIALEPDNTNFIEDLKKDKSSDPTQPVYCYNWN